MGKEMGMKQKFINSDTLLKLIGALICLLVVGYTENMFHLRYRYDIVRDFNSDDLAKVERNDTFGLINRSGIEIVPLCTTVSGTFRGPR